MSSGISTKRRSQAAHAATVAAATESLDGAEGGIRPWQLFVLAGLFAASVVVFFARGQHIAAVLLLSAMVFAAALCGMAVLRALYPLATGDEPEAPEILGGRTRAALEREKTMVLRSIKELEFDRAMGKVSAADFEEMAARLRARAIRLIQQLDRGAGYRELIERELASRIGSAPAAGRAPVSAAAAACASCGTTNDEDARFCKSCGTRLEAPAGAGN